MSEARWAIGELARRTGVAPSTLRYYEDLGVLPPAQRVSGQRRYGESSADAVGMILLLRDTGFSLKEIKAFMGAQSRSSQAWRALAYAKIHELDERIAEAQVARDALSHALHCRHVSTRRLPELRGRT